MRLLLDFRKFLFRGNIVELAVAVVIGTAFAALVKALVADILTPLVAMIFGKPSFSSLSFTINSSHFAYGDFINNVITFVSVAAAIFFFVVKPMDVIQTRRKREDPTTKECPACTSEIPINARRCPACTEVLVAGTGGPEMPGGPGGPGGPGSPTLPPRPRPAA